MKSQESVVAAAPQETDAPLLPGGVTLTPEQFAQLLGALAHQRDSGMTPDAFAAVMREAREPIPEQKVHHGKSQYRPEGHAAEAPPFRWPEVRWGSVAADGALIAGHAIDWDRSTIAEIQAINALRPCEGTVELTDGSRQAVRVVEERDVSGAVKRLVIAFPTGFFADPVRRNYIGRLQPFCAQLAALAPV